MDAMGDQREPKYGGIKRIVDPFGRYLKEIEGNSVILVNWGEIAQRNVRSII